MQRRDREAAPSKSKLAVASSDASTPAMLYQAGRQHMQAGRYHDARTCCERALAIGPDDADILHLAGLLALEEGQHDRALAWFSRAIRHTPKAEYVSSLGTALQRLGRLEEALQAFDKVLQLLPDAAGWRNLAHVLFELNRMDVALLAYRRVLELDPRDWDAACRAGYLCYQSGELEEALDYFGICDEVRPNNAATLHMRSVFLLGLKRFEEAASEGMRAQALDPANADTCNNIGTAFRALRRYEEALSWSDRALGLQPGFDAALYNKAFSLAKLQRFSAGLEAYDRLKIARGVGSVITDLNLAELLIELGRREDALAALDMCARTRPNDLPTLRLRAACLLSLNQLEQSLGDNRRAHVLDPANAEICHNIGALLHRLDRDEEALPWLEMADGLRPDNVETLSNKGAAQAKLHRLAEAIATFDRVTALNPDDTKVTFLLAHLRLLNGDFETGWAARESRWKVPNLPIVYPTYSQPMWLGQDSIAGKTILIYSDEGFGDAIHMARYVPMLAALGARVILLVPRALQSLMADLPGVARCLSQGSTEAMPPFETYCPMLSLPLAFKTRLETIPADVPYLPYPAAESMRVWNERLGPRDRLRVGLVWSGSPTQSNDARRSIPLRQFARILDVDATFVSLQKDVRPNDKVTLGEVDIVDLSAHLSDFKETAALVCCVDLVITVCTSVAHLAASLGRPTWILLSYTPDHRWLLDRDDSPWYPTVRLFRQSETCEYDSVLDRVRTELVALSRNVR